MIGVVYPLASWLEPADPWEWLNGASATSVRIFVILGIAVLISYCARP